MDTKNTNVYVLRPGADPRLGPRDGVVRTPPGLNVTKRGVGNLVHIKINVTMFFISVSGFGTGLVRFLSHGTERRGPAPPSSTVFLSHSGRIYTMNAHCLMFYAWTVFSSYPAVI